MHSSRLKMAFKTVSAHFGSSNMVKASGSPSLLDAPFCGRNTGPWFAGMNGDPDRSSGRIDSLVPGHFGQVQGITGGADQDCCLVVLNRFQPLQGSLSTSTQGAQAQFSCGFEGRPKTHKRAKRKSHKNTVSRNHSSCSENVAPAFFPGLPAFRSVQND